MHEFIQSARVVLVDIVSTLVFLGLYAMTHNLGLAVGLGMALSVAQIITTHLRGQKIDTLKWVSAIIVLASGTAALLTQDIRIIIIKLSIIYLAVGITMLKPGWMDRYAPPIALEIVPDILKLFGYAWAALMFFTAAVNLVAAYAFSFTVWLAFMPGFAIGSKLALFLVQFAIMRGIGRARLRRAGQAVPG